MIKENKERMMLSEHIGMTESVQIINYLFSGVSLVAQMVKNLSAKQ